MKSDNRMLEEIAGMYAASMAAAAKSVDPRLERVFKLVPREAFFPPGPWQIKIGDEYIETPTADPIYLYQNWLVALDAERGINNGEPYLHARWIGAVAPQPGETVVHIGAGTGYYTALLSVLVLPGGAVTAFELQPHLAAAAKQNLAPFENATVVNGDAVTSRLPAADVIYVNAGVAVPPVSWLKALKPGGRLIFPWRPALDVGLAVIIRRMERGWTVEPLMASWFIPCVGASQSPDGSRPPDQADAWRTQSVHLAGDKQPDDTATAVYPELWFSSEALGQG